MADLTLYQGFLSRNVPDWFAGSVVDCVPGCGLPYTGRAAVILTPERLVIVSEEGRTLLTVYYESVIRVREVEFRGLVIERNGALVAPNETFGTEIVYNSGYKFEAAVRVLNKSANNARTLVDNLNLAVKTYLEDLARGGGLIRRDE